MIPSACHSSARRRRAGGGDHLPGRKLQDSSSDLCFVLCWLLLFNTVLASVGSPSHAQGSPRSCLCMQAHVPLATALRTSSSFRGLPGKKPQLPLSVAGGTSFSPSPLAGTSASGRPWRAPASRGFCSCALPPLLTHLGARGGQEAIAGRRRRRTGPRALGGQQGRPPGRRVWKCPAEPASLGRSPLP